MMKELSHADPFAALPPRMLPQTDEPRRAAPLGPDELRRMSVDCFRVQGEIDRQAETYGPLWARQAHHLTESYHGLILALLTVAEPEAHSVKVRVVL